MDETIKTHLDAIGEHLKGKPNAFLFLMSAVSDEPGSNVEINVSKNGDAATTAGLVFAFLEGSPEISENFTEIVAGSVAAETNPKLHRSKMNYDGN